MTVFADASKASIADFTEGGVPEGWTANGGEYRSPLYSNAVDRIELRYVSAAVDGAAAVYASSNQVETQIATFTAASSAAAFDFPETTDFRSFRIAAANGLELSSFAAFVSSGSLDAPSGVVISNNVTGTSFDASWSPVDGASGYRVYVWTNVVVGASAGNVVWEETMPGATNASSTTKLSDAKFNACFEHLGWTRADKAGYPTGEDGTIRIGTSETNGWLQTPQINFSDDGMAVRFFARANTANAKSMDIAVGRVSGDVASFVGTVTLTTEMREFTVALPDWCSGDCIRFNSVTTGDRRTIIGPVAVVSGYSSGTETPLRLVDGLDVGELTSCQFAGLPSVPVCFAVEAYGRRGVVSAKTAAAAVDLSNPDKVAALNACRISSLAGKTYSQDFDSLADLTSTTGEKAWLNGTTLQYWQAYRGTAAVTSFNYNGGLGTVGGLYALSSDRGDKVRSLGVYSTKDNEFSFGIAFTNDTDGAIAISSVSYSAQQWGFKNDTGQTLSMSAKVVDDLNWISAHGYGWTELAASQSVVYGDGVAHDTPVSVLVSVDSGPSISIASGQILMLKWTVHSLKSGKPGMMGIDDVSIKFTSGERGFVFRLAGSQTGGQK